MITGLALSVPTAVLPAAAATTTSAALPTGAAAVSTDATATVSSDATATSSSAATATSSSAAAARALPPGPMRLRAALLTASDLPRGYAPTANGSMSTVSQLGTDTNICDRRISSPAQVGTAQAAFIRGLPGPMLFETLSATGPRTARAIVSGIAAAPRLCRSVNTGSHGDGMELRIYPLRAPRLGDASAGIRFVVRPPGTGMTIEGSLISVARRGVAATILLINYPAAGNPRDLNQIATTAIHKLDRVL